MPMLNGGSEDKPMLPVPINGKTVPIITDTGTSLTCVRLKDEKIFSSKGPGGTEMCGNTNINIKTCSSSLVRKGHRRKN